MENSDVSQFVIQTLESNLPLIKKYAMEKIGPMGKEIIKNESQMKQIFRTIYNLLPFPVRMAVSETEFLNFCLKNRYRLLDISETA